jgi:hypothetical protein
MSPDRGLSSGSFVSASTTIPWWNTTRTDEIDGRESALTTNADGEPGPAIEPKSGPAAPSFGGCDDEGVERERPETDSPGAVAERRERLGHAEQGDRSASWASPSPFVHGAVEPGDQLIALANTASRPFAVSCQPAILMGTTDAPGATPRSPCGPPAPTRIPASAVPWRSSCLRFCGLDWASAVAALDDVVLFDAAARYGCEVDAGSRSAIERPVLLNRGSPTRGATPARVADIAAG